MLTLNQIKKLLVDYFDSHAQISSVYFCDDFDFNAERGIKYPVVNIEYVSSNVGDKLINHIYKIVIADITESEDNEMEDNIHSDSLMVAEDFYTYIQNLENGIVFNKVSSINKFTDDTGDRASGIVFTITLGVIRSQNRCNAPMVNFFTPTPSASLTPTPTPTISVTPTMGASPTQTPTLTQTPTVTPTPSATPNLLFDTIFGFGQATTQNENNISVTVGQINNTMKFEFNLITEYTGLLTNMDIYINGTLKFVSSFANDYIGRPFRLTDQFGNVFNGTFTNGAVNFSF